MKAPVLLGLILLSSTTPLPAQPAPTELVFAIGAAVHRVDIASRLRTTILQSGMSGFLRGGSMSADNRDYALTFTTAGPAPGGGLVLMDRGGVVRTLTQGLGPNGFDTVVTQDGDYVALIGQSAWMPPALCRVDGSGGVTTLALAGFQGPVDLHPDVETGDFIVLDPPRVLRVRWDWGAVTTIANLPELAMYQLARDPRTGDFIVPVYNRSGPGSLMRVTPQGMITTLTFTGPIRRLNAVVTGGAGAAPARWWACDTYWLYEVDPVAGTMTSMVYHAQTTQLFRDRARNVATVRRAAGIWDIRLDLPGLAGRAFVLGLSLSGVRPGVALPDGRTIPLVPDALTHLTLLGLLAPLLGTHTGHLDGSGRAVIPLDVSGHPALRGVRLWMAAVILDARAPLGIAALPDPITLALR